MSETIPLKLHWGTHIRGQGKKIDVIVSDLFPHPDSLTVTVQIRGVIGVESLDLSCYEELSEGLAEITKGLFLKLTYAGGLEVIPEKSRMYTISSARQYKNIDPY